MSILFTFKGELDRRLYWIQMRQEALRFISGYRRNNIIDIFSGNDMSMMLFLRVKMSWDENKKNFEWESRKKFAAK